MWINRNRYNKLIEELKEKTLRVQGLEDDKGITVAKRMFTLAKGCGLSIHTDEFQTMMNRLFLDLAGRESNVMKTYSGTAFLKDTPEELMKRLDKLRKDASIITKELEHKK